MTTVVEFADAGFNWATGLSGWMLLVMLGGTVLVFLLLGLEKVFSKIPEEVSVFAMILGLLAIYVGAAAFFLFGFIGFIIEPGFQLEHLSIVAEACGYSDVRHLGGENIFSAIDAQGDQVTIQVTEVLDGQYAVTEIPR